MNTVHLNIKNAIAILTLSRPEALNALNSSVFTDLNNVLDKLESLKELKSIIITGKGKAFVAGADIAEMERFDIDKAKSFSQIGHNTFMRIENFQLPVIAAVNGFALGGGLELAMACDFIIASEKAKFSAPELNLGLIPGFGGTQRLTQLVGPSLAKYLLFTAEMVDAIGAQKIGLAQKVVAHDELLNEALKVAKQIASKGSEAIKAVKRTVNYGLNNGFIEGSKNEVFEFSQRFGAEAYEGMKAFLEKRKPNWT